MGILFNDTASVRRRIADLVRTHEDRIPSDEETSATGETEGCNRSIEADGPP